MARDNGSDVVAFLAGFVIGGLVGAAVALLFAPQSGEETRAQIRSKSIELAERAKEKAREVQERAEQVLGEAQAKVEAVAAEIRRRAEEVQARGRALLEESQRQLTAAVGKAQQGAAPTPETPAEI